MKCLYDVLRPVLPQQFQDVGDVMQMPRIVPELGWKGLERR